MPPFSPVASALLVLPTATIFVIGFVVSILVLRKFFASLIIASGKALLFYLYFHVYFDGTYTSLDDIIYFATGLRLLQTVRLDGLFHLDIINIAESFHFTYTIASAIAIALFGEEYFALSAFNVLTTFACGYFACRIIQTLYANTRISRWFYALAVLQPDLVSWSTVFAGKDTLILLGHLLFLYSYALILRGRQGKGLLWLLLAIFLTLNLRFYIPIVMVLLITFQINRRAALYVVGTIALAATTIFSGSLYGLWSLTITSLETINVTPIGLLTGIPHFWLTPRPFFEDPIHGFLRVANVVTWLAFPFLFVGLLASFRSQDKFARFLFIYFLTFSMFYAVVEYLNGPRHRVQLVFALLYFTWVGLGRFKLISTSIRLLRISRAPGRAAA